MFNLLAANLHDGNAHDLASSLGLIGNCFRLPEKNRFQQTDNRFGKKSGFNIPNLGLSSTGSSTIAVRQPCTYP